jgi:uridine phosphorylase
MAREPTNAPVHLRPHAVVAERVLLPGDPGRAMRVAQDLTDTPKMLNHNRGLWGYTGPAADGEPLTVQSTGLGGPSAAVVVEELIGLGARRLVRIGTCAALDPGLALGDLVVAERVLAGDGASRALGAGDTLEPDSALTAALGPAAARGTVATTDLFYGVPNGAGAGDALARDLESAAVLAVAARHGLPAAVVLLVTEDARGARLGVDDLHAAELVLGRAGATALGAA